MSKLTSPMDTLYSQQNITNKSMILAISMPYCTGQNNLASSAKMVSDYPKIIIAVFHAHQGVSYVSMPSMDLVLQKTPMTYRNIPMEIILVDASNF